MSETNPAARAAFILETVIAHADAQRFRVAARQPPTPPPPPDVEQLRARVRVRLRIHKAVHNHSTAELARLAFVDPEDSEIEAGRRALAGGVRLRRVLSDDGPLSERDACAIAAVWGVDPGLFWAPEPEAGS